MQFQGNRTKNEMKNEKKTRMRNGKMTIFKVPFQKTPSINYFVFFKTFFFVFVNSKKIFSQKAIRKREFPLTQPEMGKILDF